MSFISLYHPYFLDRKLVCIHCFHATDKSKWTSYSSGCSNTTILKHIERSHPHILVERTEQKEMKESLDSFVSKVHLCPLCLSHETRAASSVLVTRTFAPSRRSNLMPMPSSFAG